MGCRDRLEALSYPGTSRICSFFLCIVPVQIVSPQFDSSASILLTITSMIESAHFFEHRTWETRVPSWNRLVPTEKVRVSGGYPRVPSRNPHIPSWQMEVPSQMPRGPSEKTNVPSQNMEVLRWNGWSRSDNTLVRGGIKLEPVVGIEPTTYGLRSLTRADGCFLG